MKIVLFKTFDNIQQAYLVKGRLFNEEIPCFIENENFSYLMPHYQRVLDSGIRLLIYERDYERAMKLFEDDGDAGFSCPRCGSDNFRVLLNERNRSKLLVVLISLLAFIPMGNIRISYTCKECGMVFD